MASEEARSAPGSRPGSPFFPLPAAFSGAPVTSSRARIASAAACSSRSFSSCQAAAFIWCFSVWCSRSCARSESTRRWASLAPSAGAAAAGRLLPKNRYSAPAMSPSERTTIPGIQWLPVTGGAPRARPRGRGRLRGGCRPSVSAAAAGEAGAGRRMVRAMATAPPTSRRSGSSHTRRFIPLAGGSSSAHSP